MWRSTAVRAENTIYLLELRARFFSIDRDLFNVLVVMYDISNR